MVSSWSVCLSGELAQVKHIVLMYTSDFSQNTVSSPHTIACLHV